MRFIVFLFFAFFSCTSTDCRKKKDLISKEINFNDLTGVLKNIDSQEEFSDLILSNPEIMSPFFELRTPLVKDDVSQIFSLIDKSVSNSFHFNDINIFCMCMMLDRYVLDYVTTFLTVDDKYSLSNVNRYFKSLIVVPENCGKMIHLSKLKKNQILIGVLNPYLNEKKLKDVNEEQQQKGPSTVNNALFVGSTADLTKLLKNGVPKEDK